MGDPVVIEFESRWLATGKNVFRLTLILSVAEFTANLYCIFYMYKFAVYLSKFCTDLR